MFGQNTINRLTSISDSVGGNIAWAYDTVSAGHHPRVQETTTPGTVTVEYDEIGRRLKLSATGQTDTTYTYDKNSRLKTVTQGSQIVALAYDNAGRRTSLTYPNGVVTSYGYDNANRLLTINHVKTPTTIESLTYQYDAAGNRTTLARANAAASLLPQVVTNTAFDAANEQTRFNSASPNLTYDNNGNLTSFTDTSGTTTYTWNARNQLTAISGPSLSASFGYDGLGRRSSKTVNSATTGFWHDGADALAELSGSTPTATYIRSLSIDEPFIRKQSGGDEFYQTDALGSTVALTDGSGTPATTYTQEPFGKTTKTGASTNPFQYTGREEDGTALMYYRARYYHPRLQRFLREDPLSFAAGMNVYAYVGNNPISFADPMGLDIIVRYYPLGAYGLGHVGIAVNTDGDDTVDTVAFGFEPSKLNERDVLMRKNVPGAVISDMGRIRGDTIRIRTTSAQDKSITAYIANRTANPDTYNLFGRNCALFVQGALKAAGIPLPEDPYIYIPDVIFNHLKPYDDNNRRWRQR